MRADDLDILWVEQALWVATRPTRLAIYDFPFEALMACRRPWRRPAPITAVGRFGAHRDYAGLYAELADRGVLLAHTPAEHQRAAELTEWYPLLHDLTPRSVWFTSPPPPDEVEALLGWPIFMKGSRQTSRHRAALAIIRSPEAYETAIAAYQRDPILRWQPIVCRELLQLRPVAGAAGESIPPSFEFRTFWWRGQCVGAGPYWAGTSPYRWSGSEEADALALAAEAARRVDVPFLVVDVAQTAQGQWVVIEVNDGQESGYASIAPLTLWQRVVTIERSEAR